MGATSEDVLKVLQSMDASLRTLVALAQKRVAKETAGAVASDRELDDPRFGDPIVKFAPRDWTGPNFKGAHYSQCAPAFLDQLAESCEWSARKAEEKNEKTDRGKPVAEYRRLDAARARGWAKRIRSGTHVPVKTNGNGSKPEPTGWAEEDGF